MANRGTKKRHRRYQISIYRTVLLCLLIILIVFPFYVMVVGAFKPTTSLISIPVDMRPFVNLTLDNIKDAIVDTDVLIWLRNSFIISICVALCTAFIGVTGGYAFARIRFPGKNILFALVMATLMMPKQMLLIPNYLVAYNLHLTNKLYGVVLTSIAPAFGVFFSRQYISSLPSSLFEAAEMDGCGELGKFFRIGLPLCTPAIGVVSIFSFFTSFNDYIWQLLMISDKNLQTLPIGLAFSARQGRGEQMALALVATLPLIIIFLICQRFFIKGATVGAVKG